MGMGISAYPGKKLHTVKVSMQRELHGQLDRASVRDALRLASGLDKCRQRCTARDPKINSVESASNASRESKRNRLRYLIMKGGFKKNQLGWACRL